MPAALILVEQSIKPPHLTSEVRTRPLVLYVSPSRKCLFLSHYLLSYRFLLSGPPPLVLHSYEKKTLPFPPFHGRSVENFLHPGFLPPPPQCKQYEGRIEFLGLSPGKSLSTPLIRLFPQRHQDDRAMSSYPPFLFNPREAS